MRARSSLLSVLAVLAAVGCGGDDGGEVIAPPPGLCTPTDGLEPADLRLEPVASGLTSPVFVTAPPGDTRLFVLEQPGRVRLVEDGQLLDTPYIDISAQVQSLGSEQGLLGLAFHPDWEQNQTFYLSYTRGEGDGESVVEAYRADSADADTAPPDSASAILTVNQEDSNHNGGMIAFGPDGYLYWGLGDGGGSNDPNERGGDPTTLLGSMLRIDVDQPDDGLTYGIPANNPYADGSGGAPEVVAYGLRNPWRWSFDRQTGDVYIGDVGQRRVEEIDAIPLSDLPGANFGWDVLEGDECFNDPQSNPPGDPTTPLPSCDSSGTILPIAQYKHTADYIPEAERVGNSITGGYVYRGTCLPSIQGTYFYGDFATNVVRTLEWNNGAAENQTDISATLTEGGNAIGGLASFGEDGFGELYVVSYGGTIYRVVAP